MRELSVETKSGHLPMAAFFVSVFGANGIGLTE